MNKTPSVHEVLLHAREATIEELREERDILLKEVKRLEKLVAELQDDIRAINDMADRY